MPYEKYWRISNVLTNTAIETFMANDFGGVGKGADSPLRDIYKSC
jgi:hypothetical protein